MKKPFSLVAATPAECAASLVGDDLVPHADVVMNRGFTLTASADEVWPWLLQLGKRRAGWYLPRRVERIVPRSRRALRTIDSSLAHLEVGDVVPDYGGKHATLTVAILDAPNALVFTSRRGRIDMSWALALSRVSTGTRIHLRLRLAPVKRTWLANSGGDLIDLLTIAGLAAGLRERVGAKQP